MLCCALHAVLCYACFNAKMHCWLLQVSSQIWESVIVSLHPDSFADLSAFIAWLPAEQAEGKAGAATALLGNLAAVSGAALQASDHAIPADATLGSPPGCHDSNLRS